MDPKQPNKHKPKLPARPNFGKPVTNGNGGGDGNIVSHRQVQSKKLLEDKPEVKPKRSVSRGAALRAQKRTVQDANVIASRYSDASAKATDTGRPKQRANVIDDSPRLRIVGIGGMDGIGSKNMVVLEYRNDAIVIDCGNDLSVDLPGINYGVADPSYLDTIQKKLKAFVISHGHLDHISGLPHVLPRYPG